MEIKRLLVVIIVILFLPGVGFGFDHGHAGFSAVLGKHVKMLRDGVASQVDYSALKKDQQGLNTYLGELSKVPQKEFDAWTKAQQLAFLINAYNGFTLELILKNYPVESIRKIGTFLQSPWKIEFIQLFGKKVSLDDIEHGMVREKGVYDEPRIHFALVCASIGCPALQNKAFTADSLEEMLETGMVNFLSDKTRNRFNKNRKTYEVTKLFQWYGGDFTAKYGTVTMLLKNYATYLVASEKDLAVAKKANDIVYLDYDWDLNDVKSR